MTAADRGPIPAMALLGTEERVPERRRLRAGKLTAILEDGGLRDIRFDGIELVRAVSYLARDASWGTLRARFEDLAVSETEGRFSVTYTGFCGVPEPRFRYRMRVEATADGRLSLIAEGEAIEDFETNRTGFVVLHPFTAAGGDLMIRHGDGTVERTRFPERISPDQPAFDIAAMTHEPAPGLSCAVSFEGEVFEMEDQRNWADASFKTYVRPLSKPRPYVIAKGASDRQSVVIEARGQALTPAAASPRRPGLRFGDAGGAMPETALFVEEAGLGAAIASPGLTRHLIVRLDPASGDGRAPLAEAGRFARDCDASLAIELICDTVEPAAEAAEALRIVAESGVAPGAILCSPRREFRTRPSGTVPPGEHPVGAMVEALRAAGYSGRIGAGTPSNFTEFNRNPPDGRPDFVYFSVAANVHAADDASIVETLDVYPELIASARALRPGVPIWLGSCGIGTRHNPYGAAVQPNPERRRVAAARIDPRHAALFGAAYAIGIAARAAEAGVAVLTLGSPSGDFGIFDPAEAPPAIGRVQSELTRAAGGRRHPLTSDAPLVSGVAFETTAGRRALVANLGPEEVGLEIPETFRSAEPIAPAAAPGVSLEGRVLRLAGCVSAVLTE